MAMAIGGVNCTCPCGVQLGDYMSFLPGRAAKAKQPREALSGGASLDDKNNLV